LALEHEQSSVPRLSARTAVVPLLAIGVAVAVGVVGMLVLEPTTGLQAVLRTLTAFIVPVAAGLAIGAGLRGHRTGMLIAAALLDLEAVVLGLMGADALPFVALVPVLGAISAQRALPPERWRIAFVGAWIAGTVGVAECLVSSLELSAANAAWVVSTFAAVNALALAMIWRFDTHQNRALAQMSEAEARVRDMLEGVELFGVHVSAEGRVDFINGFALSMTGWTRDEVMGRDFWDVFAPPERREIARAGYREMVAGNRVLGQRRESEVVTRSGARKWVRWSHAVRHDGKGRLIGVASLGEDVTAARAGEEEVRRSAELLSTVVAATPLPTAVVGTDLTVQLWNPAAAALTGWSEEEMRGRHAARAFTRRDGWAIGRWFVRALAGETIENELIELHHRDGRPVRLRLYGSALRDAAGRPTAVAMKAVDVTESMALEEQLREAQKMEAVGRLAGGMAHDFNNSLTAIQGFASLIAAGADDPQTKEAAETILTATRHGAELTHQLLAYSRRSVLSPQIIDVNALLGAIRPIVLRLLGENVKMVIESRVPRALVRVDPGALERAIINLAANAKDAMPRGGRLTISVERHERELGDGHQGSSIVIRVADTGVGIPADLQARVFDPFFTTKPVGAGTGLGLSTVKGFVAQSGGRVSLSSRPGSTVVEIRLPQSRELRPTMTSPVAPGAHGRGETVLLVEDDPNVAVMSFQILSRNDYHVMLADSGESAIALLRGHSAPIALLLLDVILPDIHGPRLAELARVSHPESKVLFASGYSSEAIARAGGLPRDFDLIEKPFSPEQLLDRVRRAIDGPLEAAEPAAPVQLPVAPAGQARSDDGVVA
jgi:two-component system, cell cycle sensor histidine kinase and response regulator CckA